LLCRPTGIAAHAPRDRSPFAGYPLVARCPHQQQVDRGLEQDVKRHAAKEETGNLRAPPRVHHDQIDIELVRSLFDRAWRTAAPDEARRHGIAQGRPRDEAVDVGARPFLQAR
jgi:hypothetical protein